MRSGNLATGCERQTRRPGAEVGKRLCAEIPGDDDALDDWEPDDEQLGNEEDYDPFDVEEEDDEAEPEPGDFWHDPDLDAEE